MDDVNDDDDICYLETVQKTVEEHVGAVKEANCPPTNPLAGKLNNCSTSNTNFGFRGQYLPKIQFFESKLVEILLF